MTINIDHTLEINAPKETVWRVISDMPSYGEWNPFVVACESTLQANTPIKMRVRVFPFIAMPQKETIFEHIPGEKLSYGINIPFGALQSHREHVVHESASGTTTYESHFKLSGWLSPIVKMMLNKRLQQGFDGMSYGVRARALSLVG